jgi:hypothetical protein
VPVARDEGTSVRRDFLKCLVSRSNIESESLWIGVCGDGAKGESCEGRSTIHYSDYSVVSSLCYRRKDRR